MDVFTRLGLPARFDIPQATLEKAHRELARALHPDRFVQASASERRASLEQAIAVNEAFRTLRDPLTRAEALFGLLGVAVGEKAEPSPAPAVLMDILENAKRSVTLSTPTTTRKLRRSRVMRGPMKRASLRLSPWLSCRKCPRRMSRCSVHSVF